MLDHAHSDLTFDMSSQVCALLVLQLALLSWPATGSPVDRGYTLPVLQKRDGDSQASCNTDSVPALSTTPVSDDPTLLYK